jgi:HSP20 family protein
MTSSNSITPATSRVPTAHPLEHTPNAKAGVRPTYHIDESDEGYEVITFLPGVTRENLDITAEGGVLTITGERAWKQPTDWISLYRESSDRPFVLSLEHDNVIDADKITAALTDGVLRLTLPKTEASRPRKIAIT